MTLSHLSHISGKTEDFLRGKVYMKLLKEQKLVITKIFVYILKRYYNNSKALKKRTKSLKLSTQLLLEIGLASIVKYLRKDSV